MKLKKYWKALYNYVHFQPGEQIALLYFGCFQSRALQRKYEAICKSDLFIGGTFSKNKRYLTCYELRDLQTGFGFLSEGEFDFEQKV